MTRTSIPITVTLDRGILEHEKALHIRRMRAAVWLYLDLLARLPPGTDEVALDLPTIARAMGLPEGTIRSWLGHLRKHRYVRLRWVGDALQVSVRHVARPPAPTASPPPVRLFTVAKLERALGEIGHRDGLASALDAHDDGVVKRALAGALAVPSAEIRRSRTALFLYLLKRHAEEPSPTDPRA
jgi:hypothetical protein